MPWCDTCDCYLAPNSVKADGTCPSCDNAVDRGDALVESSPTDKVPWHFWLLVGALVVYLGWRLIQGVVWLAGRV